MHKLALISHYNMTDAEAKVYKLCLIWEHWAEEELAGCQYTKISKGDPRKCLLFKYCHKLLRETNGLIKDEHYKYYILAQIIELKKYNGVRIEPSCLVGDKAWWRWKRWWTSIERTRAAENRIADVNVNISKVTAELKATKNFLSTRFPDGITKEGLKTAIKDGQLNKWASFGKVSSYFIVLSGVVADEKLEDYAIDLAVYKPFRNEAVYALYNEIFNL